MNHPDLHRSVEYLTRLEEASVATRQVAEMLGQFRVQLLEAGFDVEGAERLTDTMLDAVLNG